MAAAEHVVSREGQGMTDALPSKHCCCCWYFAEVLLGDAAAGTALMAIECTTYPWYARTDMHHSRLHCHGSSVTHMTTMTVQLPQVLHTHIVPMPERAAACLTCRAAAAPSPTTSSRACAAALAASLFARHVTMATRRRMSKSVRSACQRAWATSWGRVRHGRCSAATSTAWL